LRRIARGRDLRLRAGLISVAGGKLTTYRLIAAEVIDRVRDRLVRTVDGREIGRSRTADLPLPGGSTPPETLAAAAAARDGHGVARDVIDHLAGRYGSRLSTVLGMVASDRSLGAPVLPAQPDPRAEVVAAVEAELALTLEDVLRRRTQLALFDSC